MSEKLTCPKCRCRFKVVAKEVDLPAHVRNWTQEDAQAYAKARLGPAYRERKGDDGD